MHHRIFHGGIRLSLVVLQLGPVLQFAWDIHIFAACAERRAEIWLAEKAY
jgi:hypothetical protein